MDRGRPTKSRSGKPCARRTVTVEPNLNEMWDSAAKLGPMESNFSTYVSTQMESTLMSVSSKFRDEVLKRKGEELRKVMPFHGSSPQFD